MPWSARLNLGRGAGEYRVERRAHFYGTALSRLRTLATCMACQLPPTGLSHRVGLAPGRQRVAIWIAQQIRERGLWPAFRLPIGGVVPMWSGRSLARPMGFSRRQAVAVPARALPAPRTSHRCRAPWAA